MGYKQFAYLPLFQEDAAKTCLLYTSIHLDLVDIGHGDKAVQLHIQMLSHCLLYTSRGV